MKKIDFGLEKLQLLNSTNKFYGALDENLIRILKWFFYLGLDPKEGGDPEEYFIWAQIIKRDGEKICIYLDKIKDKWKIKVKFYKVADYVNSLNSQPMYEFTASYTYDNLKQLKEMIDSMRPEIVEGLLEIDE